ncbi:fibronectin type III domain-containing protein [Eubacterium sp.]
MKKKITMVLAMLTLVMGASVATYGSSLVRNDDVLWLYVEDIDLNDKSETEKIEGISYDGYTNTLTLKNCNITTDSSDFIYYYGDIPLNINIEGNNTITGTESEGMYNTNFLDCESNTAGKDGSVNITGGGTLNLNKVRNITASYILSQSIENTININNVTINAEGGGIYSHVGNLKIENSTVKISNFDFRNSDGISLGTSDNEYGGKIDIKNSLLEIKPGNNGMNTSRTAIRCRSLNVNGLNIYAGAYEAKWKTDETGLLGKVDDKSEATPNYPMKSTEYSIGYVLITNQILALPGTVIDNHTSINIRDEKKATYFETGYTGNKICNVCGKIIETGKTTAKIAVKTPAIIRGKKKITVKYKKIPNATGFEIGYKKAGGKWKVKKYRGNKNCAKTIKGLKSSKKYTIKLRAVKGKLYSNWSKGKTVKVK